jgi:hypothetical protein
LERHHRARRTLAVGLALAVAACSGNDTPAADSERAKTSTTRLRETSTTDSSTTTTSAAGPSSTVVDPAHQEIIDRYIAYWDARFAANSGTPNPTDPALAEYATGAQLDAVIAETQANLDQGLALRPAAKPHSFRRVNVVSVDGDLAVVQECYVADGIVYRRSNGEVVNDDVATHNVRGELRLVDGAWRVSHTRLVQRWEGVDGCALAS